MLRVNLASLVVLLCATVPATGQQRCLRAAWAAYERQQYAAARTAAQQCVASFAVRAQRDQAQLAAAPIPPTGTVHDRDERNKILARWSINDVVAAYWIIGVTSQQLYEKSKDHRDLAAARAAFKAAMAFPFGRVFDPQGNDCCFWSPAEDARNRLQQIGSL